MYVEMKNLLLTTLLLLHLPMLAQLQFNSLPEVLKYADSNDIAIQSGRIGQQIANLEKKEAKAGMLPYANVSLGQGVILGRRVIVHPGAVIGADGFGIAFAGDHWEKVPQMGSVEIGDDCEIGANTCIDRGAIENTVLEEDVRVVALRLLMPASPERLSAALEGVERVLVVEQSHGRQFHRYLRAYYDIDADVRVLARPGPLLITPGEIVRHLEEWS
mgnify:CR=1 FL=1